MDHSSLFTRLDHALSISSSSTVTGYGRRRDLRACESSDLKDNFLSYKSKDEVESLLSNIKKIYDRAELEVGALGNGCCSCLGLLDPVTNIRLNRLLALGRVPPPADEGGQGPDKDMMAQRSLDGLIAFLTRLFPYLPDAEAMAYIEAAAADTLVAALLVMNSRRLTIDSFITSTSFVIALRSAAVAAKHPDPDLFIRGWKGASLSPAELTYNNRKSTYSVKQLYEHSVHLLGIVHGSPTCVLQLEGLWELAKHRLPTGTEKALLKRGQLPSARGAIKRMLLSVIHGYYLKSLAILPKEELTERYHRSLLIGGHCYGPLDPVSNIIVNTIWYELRFPSAQVEPLNMISTESLWRIAARSLYGLVTFLCHRKKDLTFDQALQDLLDARGNLTVADPEHLSDHDGKKTGRHRGASIIEAYMAAARSAKHPRPNAQADFLGAKNSVERIHSFSVALLPVSDGCTLTKESFSCLLALPRSASSVGSSQQLEKPAEKLCLEVYPQFCRAKSQFWLKDQRVTLKVEAVLHEFNETAAHKYNLHVICGVNEFVVKEFSLDPEVEAYNPWTPYKYHYSHINFLATSEGSCAPKLFFAECSNHGTGTSWCVPVPLHTDAGIYLEDRPNVGMRPEAARCIFCESEMGRICHPITEMYHGRDDFEFDEEDYSNDKVLFDQGNKADWVHDVADDAIYTKFTDGGEIAIFKDRNIELEDYIELED